MHPRSTKRSELIADGVIHAVGTTVAVAGVAILIVLALVRGGSPLTIASLAIYGCGLLAMLSASALYNLTRTPRRKAVLRRLDHAAIFVMIAASYTPFVLVKMDGPWGIGLFAFVWVVAATGVIGKLAAPSLWERLSVPAYLLLGWTVLVALEPLSGALPRAAITLLLAGGVLYSIGVVFHLWRRLPYQNAIWHALVLAGAACHYSAILAFVALPGDRA